MVEILPVVAADPIVVPEVAFAKKWYAKTQQVVAEEQRAIAKTLPVHKFNELTPGLCYVNESYGGKQRIFTVLAVTPKGSQVKIATYPNGYHDKLTKSSMMGDFIALNDTMISLLGVTHRMIVEEAVKRKLEVPARVRIEYPELFVDIPARFAKNHISAEDRVRDSLRPTSFGRSVTTEAVIEGWIDNAHQHIANLTDECKRHPNPNTKQDYDRCIRNELDDIDFYRWLQQLVQPGGVFYISETQEAAA